MMKSLEMRADRNQKGGTESLGGFDKRSDEAVSSHHQRNQLDFEEAPLISLMLFKDLMPFWQEKTLLKKTIIMKVSRKPNIGGKLLLPIIFMLLLSGCDIVTPLLVNGTGSFEIETECGKVKFMASQFRFERFITVYNYGENVGNVDSVEFDSLLFPNWHGKNSCVQYCDEQGRICKDKEKARNYTFSTLFMKKTQKRIVFYGDTIYLLPSDLVLCNGHPIMNDTIRIYKNPKLRYQ